MMGSNVQRRVKMSVADWLLDECHLSLPGGVVFMTYYCDKCVFTINAEVVFLSTACNGAAGILILMCMGLK